MSVGRQGQRGASIALAIDVIRRLTHEVPPPTLARRNNRRKTPNQCNDYVYDALESFFGKISISTSAKSAK